MIACWIVPSPPEREFFASLIGDLAARLAAPVFEPHVTLHGGDIDHARAVRALRELPAAAGYELEIEGVHSSAQFTKTLFVRFRLSDEIRQLRGALAQALELENAGDFDPHLSLLYKEMTPDEQGLARSIKLPFQRVTFDKLKLIAHPPRITTRAEVEAWREVGERGLTNAAG